MTEINIPTRIPSILDLPLPSNATLLFDSCIVSTSCSSPETEKGSSMKGMWSKEEDVALTNAVKVSSEPISWDEISKAVPGRSSKQCRERWLFRLCPGVNKAPFQKWEDELIVLERQKIGNHWTAIAAKLPGRTSCAVKNRWYTVLRNRVKSPQRIPVQQPPVMYYQYPVSFYH